MAEQGGNGVTVEPFGYADPGEDAAAEWGAWELAEVDERGNPQAPWEDPEEKPKAAAPPAGVNFETRMEEEARRSFEAGRARGRAEVQAGEHEAHAAERRERAEQLERLTQAFAAARDRYLEQVEREVVKLALAVAARVLRREAQLDPLLLLGAVRVALGQLSASTEVRLRVPAADLALWSEAVALVPNLAVKPEVAAGDGMRLGDCVIETVLGSVDLGVRAQLVEIESGFFDRAGRAAAPERAA